MADSAIRFALDCIRELLQNTVPFDMDAPINIIDKSMLLNIM